MTLKTETRFNIGDPVYFLNTGHEITKGTVIRIDARVIAYNSSYTGKQEDFARVEYEVSTTRFYNETYSEEDLYSTPDEIVAVLNDQIERQDFD